MKQILFISILFLSFVGFSQTELSEISSYYEAETSILSYRIDSEIQFDREKGYGIKMKTPQQFTSFAVGWIGQLNQHPAGMFDISYKVHKPGKGWTDWKSDEGFTNIGETRNRFNQSDLLFGMDEYLHDSVEFYISCPENEVIDTLFLITMDISASLNQQANLKSGNLQTRNCPALPEIIPRSDWCGEYTECHNPTYAVTYRSPTHTVIHHGASPDAYTDGYAVVRSYWNYHVNTNGWNDIGYNYLFDKFGNLFQGRYNPNMPTQDVHAAHAGYANTYSIGLNYLGNSDEPDTQPTTVQTEKCAEFLAWWYNQKGFDPISSDSILNQAGTEWITLPRICGHKDVNPGGTTCPGDALYALLPNIRTQTNQILIDCDDPIAPTTSIQTDRNWYNKDFSVTFNDADNEGGSGVKYSFYQVMDFDGSEWRANTDYGFLNDNFDTQIHPDWTDLWGIWAISAGHLLQSDEVTSNSNLYANIQQEIGNVYLYHWQQKISGSGANRRSGMPFFCSEPTETGRGDSYMLYLRADNNTVQIYKYIDNSYSATGAWYVTENFTINADAWYDVKLIFDTNTGEISVFLNDELAASTVDPAPFTSGTAISLRTGECQTEYDDLKVYRSREQAVEVNTALSEDAEIRYESIDSNSEAGRIRTLLIDNANNWSISASKNIFTDFQAPETNIPSGNAWETGDFTVSINDTDLPSGIEKAMVSIADYNGLNWTANADLGFIYDDFSNGMSDDWTSAVGTWTEDSGVLVQTDESNGNTNSYIALNQELSNQYLYEFDMKIDGSDPNIRGGFHYFSDNPELPNRGNGYFVWFRLASQDLEIYKVTDDVFSLEAYTDMNLTAGQWVNVKLIFNRISGETFLYMDNQLVGEYIDDNPWQSGEYVSFRSGNSNFSIDNFKVYRSRYPEISVEIGNPDAHVRYQNPLPSQAAARIYSIVNDSAKNISSVEMINQNIDWTAPTAVPLVNDGLGADVDAMNDSGDISANWDDAVDENSGILAYYYAVGSTSGDTDILDWTNNSTETSFVENISGLSLGETCYVAVKAENNAGLFSEITVSDGFTLTTDISCPGDFDICLDEPAFLLEGASPTGGDYTGPGVAADNSFNASNAGLGAHTIIYTYETESCEFVITVDDIPEVACPSDITLAQDDEPYSLQGGMPEGGSYFIEGMPIEVIYPGDYALGDYLMFYTYQDETLGCGNTCFFDLFITPSVGINSLKSQEITVYPNPNHGHFTLEMQGFDKALVAEIVDMQGRVLYQESIPQNTSIVEFKLDNLSAGMYLLNLKSDGFHRVKKLTVK
ncbi:MAG: N-acetylmuramoyl-L-alanine amidase [Bacteroidales bacterium]|jgi:hypothetical protein|nr:N-acetylmuramoyl-L-alanine amidase [Bacteroidales bacterium]